jgi:hypothetical protein
VQGLSAKLLGIHRRAVQQYFYKPQKLQQGILLILAFETDIIIASSISEREPSYGKFER